MNSENYAPLFIYLFILFKEPINNLVRNTEICAHKKLQRDVGIDLSNQTQSRWIIIATFEKKIKRRPLFDYSLNCALINL